MPRGGAAGGEPTGFGVNSFCTLMPSGPRSSSPAGAFSRIFATRACVGHPKSIPLISSRSIRSGVVWPSAVFTVRSVAQLFPRDSAVSLPLVMRTRFWLPS